MRASLVIVNWNSAGCLRDCLDSVVRHCDLDETEVVVVDNGSFDGSGRLVASSFGWARFVQLDTNGGFARACNRGAAQAEGRVLVFLNPDTLLHEDTPGLLARRLDAEPRAAVAGARVLNRDGSVQTSCVQSFPTVLNQLLDADGLRAAFPHSRLWGAAALAGPASRPARVEAVSGACLAVRRDAFAAVGGFTEDYFLYGEDLDLCRKLHRAGWDVLHAPETSLVHLGGASSRQIPGEVPVVLLREAVRRFLELHRGRGAAVAYRVAMGAGALARLTLLPPASLVGARFVRDPRGSRRKWLTVLRWSLGLIRPDPRPAPPIRASGAP